MWKLIKTKSVIRNRLESVLFENDFFLFADDENIDLSLRNSDDEAAEAEEQTNEADEKRRLERLEREKWIQGKLNFFLFWSFNFLIDFFLPTENENKLSKKKLSEAEELNEDDEDSQFFKTASKAMSKLNMRRSISVESTKQPSIKEFKSPKAKIPLQIIVRSIFNPLDYLQKNFRIFSFFSEKKIGSFFEKLRLFGF